MQLRLPRDFAHEVYRSVRILARPGFGASLLQQIIAEGIATAFRPGGFPENAAPPGQELVGDNRHQRGHDPCGQPLSAVLVLRQLSL
jgi:hypothetical protein